MQSWRKRWRDSCSACRNREPAATTLQRGLALPRAIRDAAKASIVVTGTVVTGTVVTGITGMTDLLLDTPLNDAQRAMAEIVRSRADSPRCLYGGYLSTLPRPRHPAPDSKRSQPHSCPRLP